MLQFGQGVLLFFDQLNFGFVAPQTVDSRISHLPNVNAQNQLASCQKILKNYSCQDVK